MREEQYHWTCDMCGAQEVVESSVNLPDGWTSFSLGRSRWVDHKPKSTFLHHVCEKCYSDHPSIIEANKFVFQAMFNKFFKKREAKPQ